MASTKIRNSVSLTDAIIPWLAIDARFAQAATIAARIFTRHPK